MLGGKGNRHLVFRKSASKKEVGIEEAAAKERTVASVLEEEKREMQNETAWVQYSG